MRTIIDGSKRFKERQEYIERCYTSGRIAMDLQKLLLDTRLHSKEIKDVVLGQLKLSYEQLDQSNFQFRHNVSDLIDVEGGVFRLKLAYTFLSDPEVVGNPEGYKDALEHLRSAYLYLSKKDINK